MGGYAQYRIVEGKRQTIALQDEPRAPALLCAMKTSDQTALTLYEDIFETVEAARAMRSRKDPNKIAMHLNIEAENTDDVLDQFLLKATPQSLVASEAFASVLAAIAGEKYKITYAGNIGADCSYLTRCYTVDLAKA